MIEANVVVMGDEYATPSRSSGGVSVYLRHKYWRVGETLTEIPNAEFYAEKEDKPDPPPTFDLADFGESDRLAWAHGACEIDKTARILSLQSRYLVWVDKRAFWLVDTTRPERLRIECELFRDTTQVLVHRDQLWLSNYRWIAWLPLAPIMALFDDPASNEVHVRTHYPLRRPTRQITAEVSYSYGNEMTLKFDSSTFRIPFVPGMLPGTEVTLIDELATHMFRTLQLRDGTRHILQEPQPDATHPLTATLDVPVDPAGGPIVVVDAAPRQLDLDQLFHQLADEPDDIATREILVDLMQDSGEAYAPLLARLIAGDGDEDLEREALGTLERYFDNVMYRGGSPLPYGARLAAAAPLDVAIGDAIVADHRLGFFHTLRIGDGPFAIYVRLVSSPRAVALRHVDLPNAQVLAALVDGKRDRLVQLSNVKFATKDVIHGIADPTFDSVRTVHTVTATNIVAKQLEFFAKDEAGFWKRAPRHLMLTDKYGRDELLVQAVRDAWTSLSKVVAGVTAGSLTLTR